MGVYCDACEKRQSDGVSDCCKADVWGVYRTDDNFICKECGNECMVIRKKKTKKKRRK
jgi:hypothetical protein